MKKIKGNPEEDKWLSDVESSDINLSNIYNGSKIKWFVRKGCSILISSDGHVVVADGKSFLAKSETDEGFARNLDNVFNEATKKIGDQ